MYSKAKTRNTKLKKKNKVHLVFDEDKRREFLTGFHKRKVERKKKAQEKFEKQLKEEKKRLQAEARESYKKLVKSYTPIPEVEDLFAKEYDDNEVNVQITELSANELAKTNDWIGANQPRYESDQDEEAEPTDDAEDDREPVPGMELDSRPSRCEEAAEVRSKKDIMKILKRKATENVQKSKTFQKKGRMERQKQKRQTEVRKRQNSKHKKKRGGK